MNGEIFVSKKLRKIIQAVKESACKADGNGTLRTSPQKVADFFEKQNQSIAGSVLYNFFNLAISEKWIVLFLKKRNKKESVFTLTDKFKDSKFAVGTKGENLSTYTMRRRFLDERKKNPPVDKKIKNSQVVLTPASDLEKLEELIQKKQQELKELKDLRLKLVEGNEAKRKLEEILSGK